MAEFPDDKLLQDYYNKYDELRTNFNNSANPGRLQLRQLKYKLFRDSEHRKFFPTKNPTVPSKEVYSSILENPRVLPLCPFIGSSATYFECEFDELNNKALRIITYTDKQHNKNLE